MKITTQRWKLASRLIYVSLALGIINFIFVSFILNPHAVVFNWAIIVTIIIFLFYAFLAYKIGQKANWARITFLVLVIYGVVSFLLISRGFRNVNYLDIILSVLGTLLNIAACLFLFIESSNKRT